MTEGKSIASYLLILLLVLFSNGQSCYSYPAISAPTAVKAAISGNERNARTQLYVIAGTLRKEHVKARYVGGECPFNHTAISLHLPPMLFTDQVKSGNYISFISATHPFSFKLRGPPAYC